MTGPSAMLRSEPGAGSGTEPRTAGLGVVTWNVQHASPIRSRRQVDWLAGRPEADVVVLTEVGAGPGGDALAAALDRHGYTTYLPDGGGDYRVLVASRIGRLDPWPEAGVAYLPHRFAAVAVTLPDRSRLGVVGLYVPSRGPRARRNVTKRAFQNAVAAALPTLGAAFGPQTPVLVTGDLNVVEPAHQPRLPVFGAWEYDFYRAFTAAGFTDAYRHHDPDGRDHSWRGRSGTGYRIDHLFCTQGHLDRLSSCRYLHGPRVAALSDHSALAVELHPPREPR